MIGSPDGSFGLLFCIKKSGSKKRRNRIIFLYLFCGLFPVSFGMNVRIGKRFNNLQKKGLAAPVNKRREPARNRDGTLSPVLAVPVNKNMEYANRLNEYAPAWSAEQVDAEVARIREAALRNRNAEVYKFCYSTIDLTTLSCNDSVTSVTEFARKTAAFYELYPHIPNVASICVYPAFVETVGVAVDGTPMRITSVAGGFPASQTYLEVKALEVAMAVENGADEVDIVLNVGRMLTGEYDEAANEVEVIRSEMDKDIVLKVIIESGALKTPELIRKASLLSIFAGADFVKTSTGKIDVAATPEAALVICQAIRDYHEKTGHKVGFKAAGGVRTPEDAALYYTIVEETLGREWLTPDLFRIGASSAANNLLTAIEGHPVKYYR